MAMFCLESSDVTVFQTQYDENVPKEDLHLHRISRKTLNFARLAFGVCYLFRCCELKYAEILQPDVESLIDPNYRNEQVNGKVVYAQQFLMQSVHFTPLHHQFEIGQYLMDDR